MLEKDFQRMVVTLARENGWMVHHCADARPCVGAGLPDLILVRKPRVLFWELKSRHGRMRPKQAEWMSELVGCEGVEYRLYRPDDWRQIVRDLR